MPAKYQYHYPILALLVFLLGTCFSPIHAQDNDSKKKIVIKTKKIDKNGKEVIEEKILEGQAAEDFDKKINKTTSEKEENVSIMINEEIQEDGTKQVKIRKRINNGEVVEEEFDVNDEEIQVIKKMVIPLSLKKKLTTKREK